MDFALGSTVSGPVGCGWFGVKERATSDATACLTLMGVRLYNQATGSFTSTDPVPGGNSTAYNYPTDPINQSDLMVKSGTGNAHGAEFQSGGGRNYRKVAAGAVYAGAVVLGFRVVHQLFARHSWALQLVLEDTPRGMLEQGGGVGRSLGLRLRWVGSQVLQ